MTRPALARPVSRARSLAGVALAALVLAGCLPDDLTDYDWKARQPDPLPAPVARGRVLVGTASAGAVSVTLSIDEGPREGANVVYVAGASATVDASCGGAPMPVEPADDVPGATARVFLLPAAPGASCEIGATVGQAAGSARAAFPVVAVASPTTLQRAGGGFVAWVRPVTPLVGRNALVVRTFDADARPADAGVMDLYPYMDMGGGAGHSAPYRAPQRTGAGRYEGEVDFIMSGRWDLTVYLDCDASATRTTARFPGFYVFDP